MNLAEDEEIIEAICRVSNTKTEEVKVVSTRDLSRGQKWAIVSLPAAAAHTAQAAGKLRVGYVNCLYVSGRIEAGVGVQNA